MHTYRLVAKQTLPISMKHAWHYFSNPSNLPALTPSWMHLTVREPLEEKMYPGMLAIYDIKPFLGIPTSWVTEITHVQEQDYFVDVQRSGPFRFWHHAHHFQAVEDGVQITDILHYALPFGCLGRIAHQLSVERKLLEVFRFRYFKLEQLFPNKLSPTHVLTHPKTDLPFA